MCFNGFYLMRESKKERRLGTGREREIQGPERKQVSQNFNNWGNLCEEHIGYVLLFLPLLYRFEIEKMKKTSVREEK